MDNRLVVIPIATVFLVYLILDFSPLFRKNTLALNDCIRLIKRTEEFSIMIIET